MEIRLRHCSKAQLIYSIILQRIHSTHKARTSCQTRTSIPPQTAKMMEVKARLSYSMRVLGEEGGQKFQFPPFQFRYLTGCLNLSVAYANGSAIQKNQCVKKTSIHFAVKKGLLLSKMAMPAPAGVVRPSHRKCFLNHLSIHNGGGYAAAVRNPSPPHIFCLSNTSLSFKKFMTLRKGLQISLGGGGEDRERRCPGVPVSRKYLLLLLPRLRMYLHPLSHRFNWMTPGILRDPSTFANPVGNAEML